MTGAAPTERSGIPPRPSDRSSSATPRTSVRRFPERGTSDPSQIREILQAGLVCHVGFVEADLPVVIPTTYGLLGDSLVIHGIAASRLLARLRRRVEVCVNVTLFDGLVLAASAFEHSMNYRSVVLFGRARWLRDEREKLAALRAMSEHILPGRWADTRPPSQAELKQTHVLAIPLDEASGKIRVGPPSPEEPGWDTWVGVMPAELRWGPPQSHGGGEQELPDYIATRAGTVVGGVRTRNAKSREEFK